MYNTINFEITKLLKEKGYNELCSKIYLDGELKDAWKKVNYDDTLPSGFYIAPTIAEAVMWLYEKYGIWINVRRVWNKGEIIGFEVTIDQIDGFTETDIYNSPTEAYSEAILYTLKNLI